VLPTSIFCVLVHLKKKAESALSQILFYNPNVGPIPLGIPLFASEENKKCRLLKFNALVKSSK
jgi:hypothetical protein